ncbi:Uncharacterised protein [Shigella sonnei]|nr:Uncharacterised protein [Shigella sonnei]CSG34688.1 Uncharacterised protein [Shigella sonnei]
MQFARNGGTLFHHDQLLLTFLMAIQRQRGGELFNQGIQQLLLIMAKMTPLRQGRQQNTVLRMRVSQPPLQGRAAITNG